MVEPWDQLSAAKMRAALDRVGDGMLVLDRSWRVDFVNVAGAEMLGSTPGAMRGRVILELFPEGAGSTHLRHFQQALDTQEVVAFERRLPRVKRIFDIRAYPASDGLTVIFHDVTGARRLALHRRQLMDRLVAAQEAERARIAADVHDDSVQALAAVDLRLGILARRVAEAAPQLREQVEVLQQAVTDATARLRHLLFDLEPPAPGETFADSLLQAAAHIFEDSGTDWQVTGDLEVELGHSEHVQAVRIVKEALSNALRHARAECVELRVTRVDGGVEVTISDDGQGLPSDSQRPGHRGLTTMRDRAEIAGGWWRLEEREPQGTTVRFFVPTPGD